MVKKQTTCGAKGCSEEHKTMADLYQHQTEAHEVLVRKYQCNVQYHAHINAESRRKCLNRTTVKTPKECLWKAKKNQVKIVAERGVQATEEALDRNAPLLNRLPETRAEMAQIFDACFEQVRVWGVSFGEYCNGMTFRGKRK